MKRLLLRSILPFFLLFLLVTAALFCGAERIPPRDIAQFFSDYLRGNEYDPFIKIIILDLRLSRTVLALLCGALLAAAGVLFQGFFRNGLADPFGMGISSGATLGAVSAALLPVPAGFAAGTGLLTAGTTGVFAFCGALGTAFFVYLIAQRAGRAQTASPAMSLLLTGAAVSAFFSAVTSFLLLLKNRELYRIYIWTMGGFSGRGWNDVLFLLPAVVISFLFAFIAARPLDLLAAGEQTASALGLEMNRVRPLIITAGALAAAGAAAAGGTIGFIGLIAPHIARIITGPSHRRLLVSGAVTGAVLLLLADIIARTVLAPAEIPVGIITAVMGAPFFIWLLARGRAAV